MDKDNDNIIHETSGVQPFPEPQETEKDTSETTVLKANATKQTAKQTKHFERYTIRDIKGLDPRKRKMFLTWVIASLVIGITLLTCMVASLISDSSAEKDTWYENNTEYYTQERTIAEDKAAAHDSTNVTVGTYVNYINNLSIKDSSYRVTMLVWFRWDGNPDLDMANNFHIYKGYINKREILTESNVGDTHYQLTRIDVTLNKVFYTSRFPLESHQLRIFVESEYDATEVLLVGDTENSGVNESANLAGYEVKDIQFANTAYTYPSTESDPTLIYPTTDSEYMTAITVGRAGIGLYVKCFIAMYGTTLWVLIMLYICGHHRVDPLGMIPGALFGTVSNIMVGAALLPDALDLGLLEFVNIWGIMTIVMVAIYIIQINNIRSEYGRKDEAFSRFFGRAMFYVALVLAIAGNVILPLSAFL